MASAELFGGCLHADQFPAWRPLQRAEAGLTSQAQCSVAGRSSRRHARGRWRDPLENDATRIQSDEPEDVSDRRTGVRVPENVVGLLEGHAAIHLRMPSFR